MSKLIFDWKNACDYWFSIPNDISRRSRIPKFLIRSLSLNRWEKVYSLEGPTRQCIHTLCVLPIFCVNQLRIAVDALVQNMLQLLGQPFETLFHDLLSRIVNSLSISCEPQKEVANVFHFADRICDSKSTMRLNNAFAVEVQLECYKSNR